MATKLERISRLALETSRSITSSTQHWKGFLDSAAWLYKYPFQDQVLIHAQKPEATACAEIGLWNERLHRWVNRGAKGIALIDTSEEKPHLRYVFDVSDTNSRQNIPFALWQAKPEMYPRIAEELQNGFGELGDTTDQISVIFGTVMNAVMDNAGDYLEALRRELYGSSLVVHILLAPKGTHGVAIDLLPDLIDRPIKSEDPVPALEVQIIFPKNGLTPHKPHFSGASPYSQCFGGMDVCGDQD